MAETKKDDVEQPAADAPVVMEEEAAGALRNRILGLEYVEPGELALHPMNWRLHPEGQRSALMAALTKIGIADASLAYRSPKNDGQLTLIDGHLRRDLIDQKQPVLVLDLDDDEAALLLASHDVITTMALRDEPMLAALIDEIDDEIPRDLLVAIDPDLEGKAGEELDESGEALPSTEDAKHPILPMYDEGYDSVILFATSEADFAWLEKELGLPTVRDRKRIGISHVLTVEQFREAWNKRSGK